MKIGKMPKVIITAVVLVGIGVFLALVFSSGGKKLAKEGPEHQAQNSSSSPVRKEETILTLNQAAQIRSGIVVAPLKPILHREELLVYGSVLNLQGLADLRRTLIDLDGAIVASRNRQAAAQAQTEKTKAGLDALSQQYERSKALYEENRNISARKYQEAEAAWRSAKADYQAAQAALKASQKTIGIAEEARLALIDSARQQWGKVISKWLSDNTPAFESLVRQQTRLIQITLPSEVQISSGPGAVRIQTTAGSYVSAHLVSPSPRTDPRTQGMSFFYLAPARMGLLPGMSTMAYLPVGPKVKGVFVPESAVVWRQGKAWVYLQKDKTRFVRREVPNSNPVKDGFLVTKGFAATDWIAVKGAQTLLSEEFRSRVQEQEED
jgi:hypothetical protein